MRRSFLYFSASRGTVCNISGVKFSSAMWHATIKFFITTIDQSSERALTRDEHERERNQIYDVRAGAHVKFDESKREFALISCARQISENFQFFLFSVTSFILFLLCSSTKVVRIYSIDNHFFNHFSKSG